MNSDKPTSLKKNTRTYMTRKLLNTRRNIQNMSPVAKKLVQITKRNYGRKKKTQIKKESESPNK